MVTTMNPRASSTKEPPDTATLHPWCTAICKGCALTDPRLSPRVMVDGGHENLEEQVRSVAPYVAGRPGELSTSLLVNSFLRARNSTPSPGPGERDPPPHESPTPGTVDGAELHRQVRGQAVTLLKFNSLNPRSLRVISWPIS